MKIYLILIIFIIALIPADATIIDFKEVYLDYNGTQYKYTSENITNHPMYHVTDNGNSYTLSRLGKSVDIPKRTWIDYKFYPDRIQPVVTIQDYSQINGLVSKVNASVWYITVPWSASHVKSVADDLIDMDVFSRSIKLDVKDSNSTCGEECPSYKIIPKVVGGDIRLYFNPKTYTDVVYPLIITENTITVTNATTSGWTTANISLNGSRWTNDGALAIHLRNDSSLNISGLVAYWSFDETIGTQIRNVNNESGLVNTTSQGTWYGNTTLNYTTGWIGNAGLFDGVNDYVDVGNATSLNISSAITISAWVNTTQTTWGAIVNKGSGTTSNYRIDMGQGASGKLRFFGYNTIGNPVGLYGTGGTAVNIGQWVYIVGTFDGTFWKIYVNSVLNQSKTESATLINTSASSLIGSGIGALFFNGTIDEVRIYNRALSDSEVAVLYNTSMRTIAMPVIMNQSANSGNVINRTRITYTGQDSTNNASIFARQNGTTAWILIQANATSSVWYPITQQFNSMDFGVQLSGNGSNTTFFTSLEWDETPQVYATYTYLNTYRHHIRRD